MRWLDCISNSVDMNLNKLWEIVEDRGACCAVVSHVIPRTAVCQGSLSITNSSSLLKLMSIESQCCHSTIIFSVIPFSSHLESFLASGSILTGQFFPSSGQSIGASTSASVLPMNIQDWSPLGLSGLISLQPKGLSRVFSPIPQFKSISSLALSLLYSPTLTAIHDYWKNHSFDQMDLCWQSNVSVF